MVDQSSKLKAMCGLGVVVPSLVLFPLSVSRAVWAWNVVRRKMVTKKKGKNDNE
jgi:hypothetical protein